MSAPSELRYGGLAYIPAHVAKCPECASRLYVTSEEWDAATGEPTYFGLALACFEEQLSLEDAATDPSKYPNVHRWYQSDWQPIRDAVADWADVPRPHTIRNHAP